MDPIPSGLTDVFADRYRLERELGRGGMATVYLAADLKHGRPVAIKVLRPELAALIGAERFVREIAISASLQHPHLLTLIDSGATGGPGAGFLYYVMPYVEGESLRQRLEREGPLPIAEALRVVSQIGAALDYAHRQGVVHRDIKPENILLSEGNALLADFGIALAVRQSAGERLTETGLSLGTPGYMSPEQATADRLVDARSDIYSLGAVLYEMLSGEAPFSGPNAQAIIAKVLTTAAVPLRVLRPTVPESVDAAVRGALSKAPADRFGSAGEFLAALSVPPPAATPARPVSPARWGWIVAAVATVAVAAVVALRSRAPAAAPVSRIQLTTSGKAYTPVLSPDGSQVAYSGARCPKPEECYLDLMVRETATGVERAVLTGLYDLYPFQWSRDGLYLLFYGGYPRGQIGIHVVSRQGGTAQFLVNGIGNFLPNGDTIVLAEGNGPSHGRTTWLKLRAPPWSETAESIGVAPAGEDSHPAAARVSPDGRWFAVAWLPTRGYAGSITLNDRRGRRADSMPASMPSFLRWASDGRSLLLPLHLEARQESALLRIAVDPGRGRFGRRDTLSLAAGTDVGPIYDLSEDGQAMVYEATREGESSAWTAEEVGGVPREELEVVSASRAVDARISPDGRTIFVNQAQTAGGGVGSRWYSAPFGSTNLTPLTPAVDSELFASAENGRLLQATAAQDGGTRITAYDLAAGSGRRVLEVPHRNFRFLAGPDSSLLLINRRSDTLQLVDAAGRTAWRLALPDSIGRAAVVLPSPDRQAFLALAQPVSVDVGSDGNVGLPVLRIDAATGRWVAGTPLRAIQADAEVWARDGWVYLAMATAQDPALSLYRMRPDGSGLTRVGRLPFPADGRCQLAEDARRWACARTTMLSDLYLVRGLVGR